MKARMSQKQQQLECIASWRDENLKGDAPSIEPASSDSKGGASRFGYRVTACVLQRMKTRWGSSNTGKDHEDGFFG